MAPAECAIIENLVILRDWQMKSTSSTELALSSARTRTRSFLTGPVQDVSLVLGNGFALANARPVRCDQPQPEAEGQIIVERGDISSQAHADAYKHGESVWITHFAKRHNPPGLWQT